METDSRTSPAKPPSIAILKKYSGVLKSYPDFRRCLLFVAKMNNGTVKTVYIELREILKGGKSSNLRDRDLNRQARYLVPPAEWKYLEIRYVRV